MISIHEGLKQASEAHRKGEFALAEMLYCQIIAEQEMWEVVTALGTLYAQAKATGRAIVTLKHALTLNPQNAEAAANLAGVYRMLERNNEAIEWNHRSLSMAPNNPVTLSNLSGAYINNATPVQAKAWAELALQHQPDLEVARSHKALALLEMGRYEEGWKEYDSRFGVPGFHRRPYTCPQWRGEQTKLLAISGEQGLGDEIMFLTCIAQIRPLVERMVIEASPRLVKLLANSFPDIPVYGSCEELLADCTPTAWTHMGSLPGFIWPVQPNAYLKPTVSYPKPLGRKRIGLSWRGGTMTTHARLRNFGLDKWKLLTDFDADYVSLQYGNREGDARELGIEHDAAAIADLDTLSALIASCDLVVSICSTAIHQAGALGVPCICLVPNRPAWRYGLKGERMPWYDSVRLIRQGKDESWRSVVERVRTAIADHGFVPRTQSAAA